VADAVDDARLVERCLRGDSAGLREFVERFQGPVFGICLRFLGQREDAEDVTQETLLRAVRHLSQWDGERALHSWVLAIAVNRCRTWASKRARSPATTNDAEAFAARTERLSVADLSEELQIALSKLREEYRTCFILFHQQDLSCQQIGELLNCSVGTVKTWLHRARKELAETLRRRGVVTEGGYELLGL
jgi:RNA polymerase sigma-70 factor (ECF subfamily)